MLHLTSGPALMVELGLAVFCVLDALLAPEAAVRWLPRWGWAMALLAFPLCGVILWVAAGRPWRARVRQQGSSPTDPGSSRWGGLGLPAGIAPPDDIPPSQWLVPPVTPGRPAPGARSSSTPAPTPASTPASTPAPAAAPESVDAALARQLLAVHAEQERTLARWEADLRRREAALRTAQARPTPRSV